MANHADMRLGKRAPKHDPRTLRFASYLTTAIPPAPPAVDWSEPAKNLGVMLNDRLGDCTCAAMGHIVQCWTADAGNEVVLSDSIILGAYEKACGYVHGDPATDNGGVELEVLNWWRKNGLGGHKIAAFSVLDPANETHIKQAIYLFGAAYIGVSLPLSAQNQDVWRVSISGDAGDPTPGSWGGHAVPVVGYDDQGLICITWGQKKRMTWDFWRVYCDESYAVLSQDDWADAIDGSHSPGGFDYAALAADLKAVAA